MKTFKVEYEIIDRKLQKIFKKAEIRQDILEN